MEHCSILHALYVSSSFKTKYLQEHYFSILLESRSIKYTFRFNFIILTFNIGIRFLALVSPDTSDLFFFMQVPVFWTQHYALLLLPMVMIITNRYPLQRPNLTASSYWYISAVVIAAMFCFLIHLPVSIILGVNVNYVYWPPPGTL